MKSISAALRAHLQGDTVTLAVCWKVERTDGARFFFTEHDRELIIDGDTYKPTSGFNRSALVAASDLSVGNQSVVGIFDDAEIAEADLIKGLFDGATAEVFLVNYEDLSQGRVKLKSGLLGEVTRAGRGDFEVELRDLTQFLQQPVGQRYQPECRADVGDKRCNNCDAGLPAALRNPVPIEVAERLDSTPYVEGDVIKVRTLTPADPDGASFDFEDRVYRCTVAGATAAAVPAYDTTIGNPTVDGGATFVAEQSLMLAGQVLTASDGSNFAVAAGDFSDAKFDKPYFNLGGLVWEKGLNIGLVSEMKIVEPPAFELLFATPFTIQPGDKFRCYPGCDLRLLTCKAKFNNVVNFRGEPHLPGTDAQFQYPDSKV